MTGGGLPFNPEQVMSDQRIVLANQFLGATVAWQCLAGQGDANPVLWGKFQGRRLILRLCADNHLAFGADRNLEIQVLEAIQHYPWSPEVLHFSREHSWCLMRHHGCSLDQFSDSQIRSDLPEYGVLLLAAVGDMQGIRQLPPFDYQRLFEHYRRRFKVIDRMDLLRQVDELQQWLSQLPQSPLTLVHHDLHQGNFCLEQGRLVILDWEYAGCGNPWLDMAALLRYHPVELAQVAALPVCAGYSPSEIKLYLTLADKLNQQLESLWIAARN